jgi:hypothetical protein
MHIHIQKNLPCITRFGTDILNADNMGTDNAASTDSIPYKKRFKQAKRIPCFFYLLAVIVLEKVCQPRGSKKNIGRQQKPRTGETWLQVICSFLVTQVSLLCFKAEEKKKITYAGSCKYKHTTAACCMSNYPTYQHHQRNTVQ